MNERDGNADASLELAARLMRVTAMAQRWGIQQTHDLEGNALTYSQVTVLYLVRYGIITPGEVARRLGVTPRAITKTVDALEAKGMIRRAHDHEDRRKVRLCLTDAGRHASEDIEARTLEPLIASLSSLPDDDRRTVETAADILEEIILSLGGKAKLPPLT